MKSAPRPTTRVPARRPAVHATWVNPTQEAMPLLWTGVGLAALLAAVLSLIPNAHATTAIQRCVAADGTPIYTDKPCALLNAQRTPISGELLGRISREQREKATSRGLLNGDFDGSPRATPPIARRAASGGCARTPTQLTMDLQGAWALGDVNRIAESYHWAGLSHRRGQQIMQQLDRLAAQPLLQAEYFDARIGSGTMLLADAGADASGAAGIVQVQLAEGSARSVRDFEVEQYRGCYFLRF